MKGGGGGGGRLTSSLSKRSLRSLCHFRVTLVFLPSLADSGWRGCSSGGRRRRRRRGREGGRRSGASHTISYTRGLAQRWRPRQGLSFIELCVAILVHSALCPPLLAEVSGIRLRLLVHVSKVFHTLASMHILSVTAAGSCTVLCHGGVPCKKQ